MINSVNIVSLIVPATTIALPLIQVFLFVLFLAIVPGSLSATLFSYVGKIKADGSRVFTWRSFFFKVFNYAAYHSIMLAVWFVSWPQIYNDVHTGYALSGLIPYFALMLLWTIFSVLLIYAYRVAIEIDSYRPTFGLFIRLYAWNILIMFVFRQIMYYYVSR